MGLFFRRRRPWPQDAPPPPRRRRGNRLLLALAWLTVAAVAMFFWYGHDLPDVSDPLRFDRPPTVIVLDARGHRLSLRGDRQDEYLSWRKLPPALIDAVVAIEDRRFFEHIGFDLAGIGRAALANLASFSLRQGGSTITQQLAKMLFFSPERALRRKLQEVMVAVSLEARYSKREILTAYLNRAYFGAGAWGVAKAAHLYFGKDARDLGLYEAALLAGLLKAPSRYSPAVNPEAAHRRALVVLDKMVEAGTLHPHRAREAIRRQKAWQRDGSPPPPPHALETHYFLDWIRPRLAPYVDNAKEDIIIATTLDSGLQRMAARKLVATITGEGRKHSIGQGAFLLMTPDGAVKAMVGGRDYAESVFNRAVSARRQPGSAFKLFVYLSGLEYGLLPDSVFMDAPLAVGEWSPGNFNDSYRGEVSMSAAFAHSLNTVAVQVSEMSGRGRVREAARRLGVASSLPHGPSLALGTANVTLLEMTAAYAAFANGGYRAVPWGIREIRTRSGRVLYRHLKAALPRVAEAEHVAAMNLMLRQALRQGTGRAAFFGRPAAGKTGTSQDFRDAWFIGFTADAVGGVWLGNDDESSMDEVTGGGAPARLWRAVMNTAHKNMPLRPLPGVAEAGSVSDEAEAEAEAAPVRAVLESLAASAEVGGEEADGEGVVSDDVQRDLDELLESLVPGG